MQAEDGTVIKSELFMSQSSNKPGLYDFHHKENKNRTAEFEQIIVLTE